MSHPKSSKITRRQTSGVSLGATSASVLGVTQSEAQSNTRPSARGKNVLPAVDVELAGGEFVDEPVVLDRALVTSRGCPDLPYLMPKFLDVLASA